MTRREKLHLEGFLPYRLSVLSNTVSSAIAAAYFANFGLTIPEWRVMAVLAANPGLSAAEVTAREAATHFGERQNLLDSLLGQTTRNRDAVSGGVGNLVDADMAKASAQLQAAQARQGLAGQVLAIANAAPQWIMGLFKT